MVVRRVLNAFPDVNEQPTGQQATVGLVGSILLHIGVLVLWLSVQSGWIDNLLVAPPEAQATLDIVIQSVAPLPSEKVVLPLDQVVAKPRMDSTGLLESSSTPPAGSAFQSDRNLEAGSQQKPTGTAPLPTVSGRSNLPEKVLVKQEARVGPLEAQPAKASSLSKLAGPNMGAKVTVATKKQANKTQDGGEVQRPEDIVELGGELVFRKIAASSSPISKLGTPTPQSAPVSPSAGSAKTKPDLDPVEERFEEGKERSEVKGGLEQNGKTGVNASKTPMGVYMKSVSGAIGAQWNGLVKNRMDSLETGLVKVRFWISSEGKVRKVVVERSTANRQFSDLCLEAVQAARLEPPPAEAEPMLHDGLLEIPFTFSLY